MSNITSIVHIEDTKNTETKAIALTTAVKNKHRMVKQRQPATSVATASRNDPEYIVVDNDGYEMGSRGEVNGAAVAGGIAGACLAGPIGAIMAAAGAAFLAAKKEGDAGDWARKSGSTLNEVGKKITTFEKDNNILDKTTKSLVKSAGWVEKQLSQSSSNNKNSTEADLTS